MAWETAPVAFRPGAIVAFRPGAIICRITCSPNDCSKIQDDNKAAIEAAVSACRRNGRMPCACPIKAVDFFGAAVVGYVFGHDHINRIPGE